MLKAAIGGLVLLGALLTACTSQSSPSTPDPSKPEPAATQEVAKKLSFNDQTAVDALKNRVPVSDEAKSLKKLRRVCDMRKLVGYDAAVREVFRQFGVADPAVARTIIGISWGTCK